MARDPHAESKLRAAGADYVVSPYTIGAVTLAFLIGYLANVVLIFRSLWSALMTAL